MKSTVTMILLLVSMATGLMAQPTPPADTSFDVYVNGTLLAPGGQLPDAEIGMEYWGARVVVDGAVAQQGNWEIQNYTTVTSYATPSHPHQIYAHGDYSPWGGPNSRFLKGSPQSVITPGTYTIAIQAIFYNPTWSGSIYAQYRGTEQYYDIEICPYGYGVTYPPPLVPPSSAVDGSSGGGGDDGDDANCSAVAGASWGMPAGLVTILGALVWRRKRRRTVSGN